MKAGMTILCGAVLIVAAGGWTTAARADSLCVDFEDLALAGESHYNGHDGNPYPADNTGEEHPFVSRGVSFYNYYIDGWTSDWGGYTYSYWEGWSYSNHTDTTTTGNSNEFSAIAGGGVAGSRNYAVAYLPEVPETAPDSANVFRRVDVAMAYTDVPDRYGVYVTNTTYDYFTIRDGNQFSRKFGHTWDTENQVWVDENRPDWFKLIVTGLDVADTPIVGLGSVEFYLADYRNVEGAADYIIDDWTWMDLSTLVEGGAARLEFVLDSSDAGAYGINTPLYVAIDAVPEPSTWAMMLVVATIGLGWWRRRGLGGRR